jgi:hypothetical protein
MAAQINTVPPLFWLQPSALERNFLLYRDKNLVGKLIFDPSHNAVGTSIAENRAITSWTFSQKGLFLPKVSIRENATDEEVAYYKPRFWGDGWLQFAGGNSFHWQATGYIGSSWGFADEREKEVLVYKYRHTDLLKMQSEIFIKPAWQEHPGLPILLLLGWYLMVGSRQASR